MTRPSEDDLIVRYFRPLATAPGALQLGDDCAILTPPPGYDLVLKTDAVAEGIHFFHDDAWGAVARKALRVNLSDLAAKGAQPLGYLLSLALPANWSEANLSEFAAGLSSDQATFGVSLLGGDTIRSPAGLVITITAIGTVPTGRMARRGGAQAGDRIYVSGTIGDAALGLKLRLDPALAARLRLSAEAGDHLLDRYLLPRPRLGLAPAVLAHAGGAMDISDGLILDLTRMVRVSGVDASLNLNAIPLSHAARSAATADQGLMETILTGGDDYELLLTISPGSAAAFEHAAMVAGLSVTAVGTISAGTGQVRLLDADGTVIDLAGSGFRHF